MLAFHFVPEKYGLEDISKRRLKVATYDDLNDPFELLSVNLANSMVRLTFRQMKAEMVKTDGLLCFSRNWQNPVLWSHYSDKHRGLCLGFEIDEKKLAEVRYSSSRVDVTMDEVLNSSQLDRSEIQKRLFTKFNLWKYEDEVRIPVFLGNKFDNGLYFVPFSNELKLVQVIVGAESTVTRAKIHKALDDLVSKVETFKARLAFKTFQVVRQKNQKLWT